MPQIRSLLLWVVKIVIVVMVVLLALRVLAPSVAK